MTIRFVNRVCVWGSRAFIQRGGCLLPTQRILCKGTYYLNSRESDLTPFSSDSDSLGGANPNVSPLPTGLLPACWFGSRTGPVFWYSWYLMGSLSGEAPHALPDEGSSPSSPGNAGRSGDDAVLPVSSYSKVRIRRNKAKRRLGCISVHSLHAGWGV